MPPAQPPPLRRPEDLPDRASVQQLLGGDGPLTDQLIALLAQEAPRLVKQLDEAVAAQQPREAARHAHTLRGMLGNFGAHHACQAAEQLEQICGQQRPEQLAAASRQLAAEVGAVVRALS